MQSPNGRTRTKVFLGLGLLIIILALVVVTSIVQGPPFLLALGIAGILITGIAGFFVNKIVAERGEVEARLRETSVYSRSLLEASLDPLVTISPEGKITDVNKATEEATGISRDRLIGSDFSDYFTDPLRAREGYRKVISDGLVKDYALTMRHASGRTLEVLYNATIYADEAGKTQGVFAAARDVTAQRQASQYARSLLEASLDPLVTISADGKITDVNEATISVTGISRDRLVGTDFSDYFTEPEKARDGYRRVFEEGFVRDYPLTIRHAEGRLTHVLYNASVYRDVEGKITGVFAAARDVTERKRMEEELRLASLYSRSLLEASLDPLVTISPDGKITDVNRATEEVTGSTRDRLVGSDFSDYFTEPVKAREGYQKVIAEGLGPGLSPHGAPYDRPHRRTCSTTPQSIGTRAEPCRGCLRRQGTSRKESAPKRTSNASCSRCRNR